jgi:solute carrier family 45 protein 1/2/4
MVNSDNSDAPRRPRPSPIPTDRPLSSGRDSPSHNQSQESTGQNEDYGNEQSPLLQSRDEDENDASLNAVSPIDAASDNFWFSREEQQTKSSWYMFLLTLGGLGLQIGWSVEMSNGTPYLLSLGMSKAILALVWLAGPLSGVLVQPFVGLKSDRCRIKWGKRRPFVIGGGLATIFALMALAWTRDIVGGFLSIFGVDYYSRAVSLITMILAVILVYVLDFAINVRKYRLILIVVVMTVTDFQSPSSTSCLRR